MHCPLLLSFLYWTKPKYRTAGNPNGQRPRVKTKFMMKMRLFKERWVEKVRDRQKWQEPSVKTKFMTKISASYSKGLATLFFDFTMFSLFANARFRVHKCILI